MNLLFRFVHITDLHLNPLNKTPQSRSATYHSDTATEWAAFNKVMIERDPTAILVSGDYFNLKDQKTYSPPDLAYYRDFFMSTKRADGSLIDFYGIPGNHDLPKSAYDLMSTTAYQNLVHATPNVHDLSFAVKSFERDGVTVHVMGVPYFTLETFLAKLPDVDNALAALSPGIKIVMLHPDALPRADLPLHFDVCSWQDLLNLLPHANILLLGHIHQSFPILNQAGPYGPQFVSKPWSFGRIVKDYFATSDVLELQHKPMYADIEVFTNPVSVQITYREVPYVPFEQAFVRDTLKQEIEKSGKIASFITSLRESYGTVENAFKVEDPDEYLARANIPADIREIIDHYLNV